MQDLSQVSSHITGTMKMIKKLKNLWCCLVLFAIFQATVIAPGCILLEVWSEHSDFDKIGVTSAITALWGVGLLLLTPDEWLE